MTQVRLDGVEEGDMPARTGLAFSNSLAWRRV
jgi:hypothetical protein